MTVALRDGEATEGVTYKVDENTIRRMAGLAVLTRNAEPPVGAETEATAVGVNSAADVLRRLIDQFESFHAAPDDAAVWMGGWCNPEAATRFKTVSAKDIRSALVATPPAPTAAVDGEWNDAVDSLVRSISEWDDRTSPEDYPDHLLMKPDELKEFARCVAALKAPAPEAVAPTGTVISDAMVAAFQEKYREVAERYHWGHSWPAQAPSRELLEAALSAPTGEGEAL